jgi:hypothetical protein
MLCYRTYYVIPHAIVSSRMLSLIVFYTHILGLDLVDGWMLYHSAYISVHTLCHRVVACWGPTPNSKLTTATSNSNSNGSRCTHPKPVEHWRIWRNLDSLSLAHETCVM